MDSAFELLLELSDKYTECLSEKEVEFVDAFDEYLEEMDKELDEEEKVN